MKKAILYIMLISVVLFSCTNLKYLEKFEGNLSNPKTIKVMVYEIVYLEKDSLKKKPASGYLAFYDKKGRKTKIIDIDRFGNEKDMQLYQYDKYGNIIEKVSYNNDSIIKREEHTYVRKSNLLETSTTIINNKQKTKVYSNLRTKEGLIRSITDKNGDIISEIYDKKGQEIVSKAIDSAKNLLFKWEYVYDEKGNNIESRRYSPDGNLLELYVCQFDAAGHPVQRQKYRVITRDTILMTNDSSIYEYDSRGNLILEKYYDTNGRQKWSFESEITYW